MRWWAQTKDGHPLYWYSSNRRQSRLGRFLLMLAMRLDGVPKMWPHGYDVIIGDD
jgi:hypothetical protein